MMDDPTPEQLIEILQHTTMFPSAHDIFRSAYAWKHDREQAKNVEHFRGELERYQRRMAAAEHILGEAYDGPETPNGHAIAQALACLHGDRDVLSDTEISMSRQMELEQAARERVREAHNRQNKIAGRNTEKSIEETTGYTRDQYSFDITLEALHERYSELNLDRESERRLAAAISRLYNRLLSESGLHDSWHPLPTFGDNHGRGA